MEAVAYTIVHTAGAFVTGLNLMHRRQHLVDERRGIANYECLPLSSRISSTQSGNAHNSFVPSMPGFTTDHSGSRGRNPGCMSTQSLDRGDEGLTWFFDEVLGCVIHGSGCDKCHAFCQHTMNAQMQRSMSYTYVHCERMNTYNLRIRYCLNATKIWHVI